VPQYLLSIYRPEGGVPDAETMARITTDLHRLNEELHESGSWVFTGGLHAPSSATVVRADGMITDGPYLEGKERSGGIWVIGRRQNGPSLLGEVRFLLTKPNSSV
jgi:hypothetical protein